MRTVDWVDVALSTAPADRPRAEWALRRMYADAGLESPQIVWCDSPPSMALTRAFVTRRSTRAGDSVRARIWEPYLGYFTRLRPGLLGTVVDAVIDAIKDGVGGSMPDQVDASVRENVWRSLGELVDMSERVDGQLAAGYRQSLQDALFGQHDACWFAPFDAWREQRLQRGAPVVMAGHAELALSAGWALPHAHICWVSERHNVLRRDERGLLHCADGPAVAYPDGCSLYFWHGTRVPDAWIAERTSVDPTLALTHENVEQRRALAEILGWSKVIEQLPTRVIDQDADPMIGTLLECDLADDWRRQRFLRVRCGTGRDFVLPVPPHVMSALQANAWTYGLEPFELRLEART